MVARVFQVIAIILLGISILVFIVVLPVIGSFLKKVNKRIRVGTGDLRLQVRSTMGEMDDAQKQIAAVTDATQAAKKGLEQAIGIADRVVAFLNSNLFQLGLPVVLWLLFLIVAIPKGLKRPRKKKKARKKVAPVPPDIPGEPA